MALKQVPILMGTQEEMKSSACNSHSKFDIYINIEAASISTSRPISILEMSHYDLETDIDIRKLLFRPRYRSRYLFCEDFETISIRYRYIGVFGDTDFNIHFEPISIAHHWCGTTTTSIMCSSVKDQGNGWGGTSQKMRQKSNGHEIFLHTPTCLPLL